MIKRITIMVLLSVIMTSCGASLVNTLVEINTGDAKRFAKAVLTDNASTEELASFPVSESLQRYITSAEGRAYFETFEKQNGDLKTLKLEGLKGSNTDTMNYRFIAKFKESSIEKEVRVQAFEDKEIVNILVGPWSDTLKPLGK